MKAGSIFYNNQDLSLLGAPEFTLKRTPDPAPPAQPTHYRTEIQVSVDIRAEMPATVWARANTLLGILRETSEALLVIEDENGGSTSWMATPLESNLPQALERRSGRVNMSFTATELLGDASSDVLTLYTVAGNVQTPIVAKVQSWNESVRITRPDSRAAHRSEVTSIITFSGRTAFSNPANAVNTRAMILLEQAEIINALSGKEVTISFAGFSRTLQMESMEAKPSEGWEWLEISGQGRYVTLPSETQAEVRLSIDSSTDPRTGETRTSVSGTVTAASRTIATQKVDSIRAAYATASGRRLVKNEVKDEYLDGADAAATGNNWTPTWTGLNFSIEFTETSTTSRYTLSIDTVEGPDGRRIVYTGTVRARTHTTALATIASIAAGKHPMELRNETKVEWATDEATDPLFFVMATFTYEYAAGSLTIRGTVSKSVNQSLFGDWEQSITGSITAPNLARARLTSRAYIPSGVLLRTDQENESRVMRTATVDSNTPDDLFTQLSFTYSWQAAHTTTSMTYEDISSPDYSRMVESRGISGTIWASSSVEAKKGATDLLTALGLSADKASQANFTNNYEKSGTVSAWLSFRFSYNFDLPLTGTIGHDIIEATYSIQRIGQVDYIPMTEIPLGMPVQQIAFGYTIGRLVASGSCKARVQASARAWGQSRRAKAASIKIGETTHTGAEDSPDERMEVVHVPFDGQNVAFHVFQFTYSFRYASGLTGLWSSDLTA
jgi:hypothetical protein